MERAKNTLKVAGAVSCLAVLAAACTTGAASKPAPVKARTISTHGTTHPTPGPKPVIKTHGTTHPTPAKPTPPPTAPTQVIPQAGWMSGLAPAAPTYPLKDIPWSQIGQGWTMSVYNSTKFLVPPYMTQPANTKEGTEALLLIAPSGTRYVVTTWQAQRGVWFDALAWSADGRQALLDEQEGAGPVRVIDVNLTTGSMTSHVLPVGYVLNGYASANSYDELISFDQATTGVVERISQTGQFVSTVATGANAYVTPGPDGSMFVSRLNEPIHEVAANGTSETLPTPTGTSGCYARRMWDATHVLASCSYSDGAGSMWALPIGSGSPVALSDKGALIVDAKGLPWQGMPAEYLDAYQLTSGTYYQMAGACSTVIIGKRGTGNQVDFVGIPGVSGVASMGIVAASSDELEVDVTQTCGTPPTLMWFNPATGQVRDVLVANVGMFDALPYGNFENT